MTTALFRINDKLLIRQDLSNFSLDHVQNIMHLYQLSADIPGSSGHCLTIVHPAAEMRRQATSYYDFSIPVEGQAIIDWLYIHLIVKSG